MAERRKMVIEVELDLTPANNQLRGFVAANNHLTMPVQSPVGAAVSGAGAVGAAAVGLGATTAEQTAVAAALGKAEANAAQYTYGAASPNWSYLMSQQSMGGTAAIAARNTTAGFFNYPRARAVLGSAIFGLHEIGRTGSALRNADALAQFAKSPEEANLLLAEAVEQGSGGFFGSLFFGLPNAFGMEGSPAQVAQQARESVALRTSQDEIRSQLFDITDARTVRSAYASGGQSAAQAARSATRYARQIDEANQNINNLNARLEERLPTQLITSGDFAGDASYTIGGDLKLGGEARANVQLELNKERQRLGNLQDEAHQDARIHADEIARQLGIAGLVAGGASERDVRRYEISSQRSQLGGPLTDAAYRAQEREFLNQDWTNLNTLTGNTSVLNLQAGGFNRQAAIQNVQNQGFMALVKAMDAGTNNIPWMNALTANVNAQIGGINAAASRQFEAGQRGLAYQAYGLDRNLANDPLGAQLGAIEAAREEAIQQAREADLTPSQLGRRIGNVNRNAGLQSLVTQRDFNRATSDIDLHLGAQIDRALLSIGGGPTRFFRQELSGIVEQNESDVRALLRSGRVAEAQTRRELGGLQVRSAESEFYRSIQYREASPRGVYGTGTLGDVQGAVTAAAAAVTKSGSGETAGGWTPALVQQAVDALTKMAQQGIAALAG